MYAELRYSHQGVFGWEGYAKIGDERGGISSSHSLTAFGEIMQPVFGMGSPLDG